MVSRRTSLWLTLGLLSGFLLLDGCSTSAQRMDMKAADFGYRSQVVRSSEFLHRIYRNRFGIERTSGMLHVYLEGDGTPWVANHNVIAADPTPHSPLMLELMALDKRAAIHEGRPCYNGYAGTPACGPALWTDARYSEKVVDSMAQVLRKRLRQEGANGLVLFGHSGGGVLAVLLASRLPQTRALVTIGANLDIDAWTDMHGYSRLGDSLNPANEPALDSSVAQLHLIGGRDRNVPPRLLQSYRSRQPDAQVVVMPGYDHVCCWRELWPKVLEWVSMASAGPADHRVVRFPNQ
ncbi:MAG: alpha/beta hydrolase [Candidatus Thiodiazotropha sp.]